MHSQGSLYTNAPRCRVAAQVGTPTRPHMHLAVITITGNRMSYEIPVYGATLGANRGPTIEYSIDPLSPIVRVFSLPHAYQWSLWGHATVTRMQVPCIIAPYSPTTVYRCLTYAYYWHTWGQPPVLSRRHTSPLLPYVERPRCQVHRRAQGRPRPSRRASSGPSEHNVWEIVRLHIKQYIIRKLCM